MSRQCHWSDCRLERTPIGIKMPFPYETELRFCCVEHAMFWFMKERLRELGVKTTDAEKAIIVAVCMAMEKLQEVLEDKK